MGSHLQTKYPSSYFVLSLWNFCKHLFRMCNQVHFYYILLCEHNAQLLFLQQLHKKKLISFLIPNHVSLLSAMHNCSLCPNCIRIAAKSTVFPSKQQKNVPHTIVAKKTVLPSKQRTVLPCK